MPFIHPIARIGLARVLLARSPHLTAEQAVEHATQIIRGLHALGLQVGPVAAFGPHEGVRPDALDELADRIEDESGRRPWLPQ